MVYIPFVTTLATELEQPTESNVVEFPRLVSAEQEVRRVRRNLTRAEECAVNDDPNAADLAERIRAVTSVAMIPEWMAQLRSAEAEVAMLRADDVLTYRGRIYQAVLHSAGAN